MANDLRLQVLLQALDKASAPLRRIGGGGKEAADGLRKTRDQLRQLNQAQQQVSGFRKLKNDAEASGIALRAAQQRAAQMRQEMAATDAPTRKAAAAYNKAEREVTKLKNAHVANLTAVREQRAALSAAGVSANGLGAAERRLGMEVSFATAKLHRQTDALRAQGIQQQRLAALDRARQANLSNRAQLGGQLFGAVATVAAMGYGMSRVVGIGNDFDYQLQLIGNTADMTGAQVATLRGKIEAASKATGQSASTVERALGFLVAAGQDTDTASRSILAIGRTSTAAGADIEDVSRAAFTLTDALNVQPEGLQKALDILAQAGKEGNVELRDMAKQLPVLGAGFRSFKLQGNEAVATLGAALEIARKGAADPDEAANNMRNYMAKVLSPATLKKAQDSFGLDLYQVIKKAQTTGGNPFEASIEAVLKATGGDQKKLGELFQDMQVQNFLKPMMQNWGEYQRIKAKALAATGVTDRDFAKVMASSKMQLDQVKNSGERLAIVLARTLAPGFARLSAAIVPVLDRLASFVQLHPKLVAGLVGITSGLVALRLAALAARFAWTFMGGGLLTTVARFGPVAAGAQGLAVALGAVTLPVWGLVAALAVVVGYLAWKYWGPITAYATGFGAGLRDVVSPAVTELTNALAPLKSALDGVLTPFKATNAQLGEFNSAGAFAGVGIGTVFKAAIAPLTNVLNLLSAIVFNLSKIRELTPGGAARAAFGAGGTPGSHIKGGAWLGAQAFPMMAMGANISTSIMRPRSRDVVWNTGAADSPAAPAGFYKPLQAGGTQTVTHNHYPIEVTAAPGRETDAAKAVSAELDRRDRAKAAATRSRLSDTE
jgi:TP901 family phage tail tape measure protein